PIRESQPRWRTWTTGWVMSWVLTAVAALAVGAAAFEVQNTWLTERPAPPPVTSQLPQQVP
ncbi:MAG TPA: hypothetical protein VG273_27335, partial [Bryobacteraceae bacterium]|nr:hypothetical protein [Bryobacteraceae bacterium]